MQECVFLKYRTHTSFMSSCFVSLFNYQRTTHREHTAAALLLRDATIVASPSIIYEELETLICATLCFVDNLWEKVPRLQPLWPFPPSGYQGTTILQPSQRVNAQTPRIARSFMAFSALRRTLRQNQSIYMYNGSNA